MAASLRMFSGLAFRKIIKHEIRRDQNFSRIILKASFSYTPVSYGVLDYVRKLNPFHQGKDVKTETQKDTNDKRPTESFEAILDEIEQEGDGTLGVKKLKDRAEIKNHIYHILENHIQIPTDVGKVGWMDVKLDDQTLKFAILRDCMMATGRVVPNLELNNMKTIGDVIKFYQVEEKDTRIGHPVAEWFIENRYKFPPNMKFIPYVKEVGVRRQDRVKKQKIPKKVKEKLVKEKLYRKERLAERRKLKL
ncbi:10107_t:CDS:2 [Acaulospora morrowiae]|uniref:Large ribosomal subunit protein mL50 n=1 Tax=Acaulospora morrowiae TaxID=94023 RepID=A0A9N8ZCI7_9GLOM|nr:10107_t:CDS:2 [Acaulospora morrowiae]